jgi:membrane protein DedA with SNARE-associated domain
VFDFLDGPVRQLVTDVYNSVGYVGVAVWVVIESVIVPIPSEIVLPFAGFLAAFSGNVEPLTGRPWNVPLIIVAGTIGATIGALVAYAIGYFGGRPLLLRWGRYLLIDPEDLAKTEAWFERYGHLAAFLGRLAPVVRSLVSFAAGIARMPLLPFVVFTTLGSAIWTTGLVVAGFVLGENWEAIIGILKRWEDAMLGALVIGIVVFVWWQLGHPGYRKRSGAAPGHLAVGSAVGPAVGSAVGPAVSSSESDPRAAAGAGDLATAARADDRGTGDEAPRLRSDPT